MKTRLAFYTHCMYVDYWCIFTYTHVYMWKPVLYAGSYSLACAVKQQPRQRSSSLHPRSQNPTEQFFSPSPSSPPPTTTAGVAVKEALSFSLSLYPPLAWACLFSPLPPPATLLLSTLTSAVVLDIYSLFQRSENSPNIHIHIYTDVYIRCIYWKCVQRNPEKRLSTSHRPSTTQRAEAGSRLGWAGSGEEDGGGGGRQ